MPTETQPRPKSRAVIWFENHVRRMITDKESIKLPTDANRLNLAQLHEVAQTSLNIFSRHPNSDIRKMGLLILSTLPFKSDSQDLANMGIISLKNVTSDSPFENVTDVLRANQILLRYFPKGEQAYKDLTTALHHVTKVKNKDSFPLVNIIKDDFRKAIVDSLNLFNPPNLIVQAKNLLLLRLVNPHLTKQQLKKALDLTDKDFRTIYSELANEGYFIMMKGRRKISPSE